MSKESSILASKYDGFYVAIMMAITNNYIAPFALLIGATALQVGLLTSIPQIASSFVQLWSTEITRKFGTRLKIIVPMVLSQAVLLMLIPVILLLPQHVQLESYIFIISLSATGLAMSIPPWASLMSDIIDKEKYGEYFAWRGKFFGIVNLVSILAAGIFLYFVPNKITGFVVLFLVAGLCRIFSGIYISKMDDVPVLEAMEKDFSYWKFIRRFRESNFVKFVLFVSLINFTLFLAVPFFTVYMLRDLKYDYFTFTVVTAISSMLGFVTLPFWGRLADKYGNVKVIRVSLRVAPFLPLLWMASGNPFYLTFISAIGGYAWGGFIIGTLNYIFDAVSVELRTRCIAYFNFTNGFFIFLGATVGGYLATHLPSLGFTSNLILLFAISGLGRALVNLFLINSFKEVRKVHHISDKEIFYVIMGISTETGLRLRTFGRK